jgi:hypothetical protein
MAAFTSTLPSLLVAEAKQPAGAPPEVSALSVPNRYAEPAATDARHGSLHLLPLGLAAPGLLAAAGLLVLRMRRRRPPAAPIAGLAA